MPEVGLTRELSVTEVNQIQHRRNVIIISILAFVFLGGFFFSLRDLGPAFAIGTIFLLGFFLISFINIRAGFVLVILAFLFSPEISLPFSQYRGFTIRAEDTLIIILILTWLGRLAMGLQKHFLIHTPLNLPIFLIIVWNIICSTKGILAGVLDTNFCIMTNLKIIEFFMVYFLVVNNINNVGEVKFIFCALMITTLVVSIYAIFQIPKTQIFTINRLAAPFEGTPEPNTLGVYLSLFFGMALSIFIYAKPSLIKKVSLLLLVTLPLPIMFSLARTAYVVCLGIIIVLAIVSRRGWLFWMLIIFLLLSPFILPKAVINRALYSFQDRRYFGFLDPSSAYRILIWKKAWWFIVNHPIFGGGLTRENVIDSQYARVIIETGIVGFILFSWLLCRLVKLGVRLFKAIPDDWIKGLAVGFIACVSGLIVSGFAAITFNIVRIMEPFWALAALTAYLLYFINTQRENPAEIKAVNKI